MHMLGAGATWAVVEPHTRRQHAATFCEQPPAKLILCYGDLKSCTEQEAAPPLPLTGSCDDAQPVGDLSAYDQPVRFATDKPVTVYSRAWFEPHAENNPYLIGAVGPRPVVLAQGLLKDAEAPSGTGWAVVVQDPTGKQCRGYVSSADVKNPWIIDEP